MILKFSADYCQPCKQLTKILEGVGIEVKEVDIAKEPELTAKYNIRNVPTMVYVFDDAEYGRLIGLKTAKEITEWVDECETNLGAE